MAKVIRTFNASEAVCEIINAEAPQGRGFSKWVNDKILAADNAEKNQIEVKSEMRNVEIEF